MMAARRTTHHPGRGNHLSQELNLSVIFRLFTRSGRLQRLPRAGSWYLFAGVLLTAVWLLAASLAPDPGLTRSYYYPLHREADPTVFDGTLTSAVEELTTGVELTFVDEHSLPNRDYLVRWRGVWFSPRPERIHFRVGADDGVILRVDGQTVAERQVGVDRPNTHTVQLGTGVHRLEIDYWQRGGGSTLNVQWAPAGGDPEPIGVGRLFPVDPGVSGYLLMLASVQLGNLALLVWAGGAATLFGCIACLIGRMVHRGASTLTADEARKRLRAVLFPAFLGPSQILLFGPWTMHATNRPEFLASFWSLAPHWLWLIGPVVGVLGAFGLILPAQWFRRYVAMLSAVGALLWVQGNLLVADYGLLDGGDLDLASHAWRTPLEAGLWIGVAGCAVFFANAVWRAAPTASVLLVTVQTAALLLSPLAPSGEPTLDTGDVAANWRLPPTEIYELSRSRNIIHIVLDMFPTRALAEIRNADGPAFDDAWSGFTWFRNHLGAFPATKASMPAMLTGVPYRNETSFSNYREEHPSVFHALGQQGYRLRSLTADVRDHPSGRLPGADTTIGYTIPRPYGSYRDYVDSASAQLLDLSLFRHAPHDLKARVYRDGDWLLQQPVALRRGTFATAWRALGDAAFLIEFASSITAGGESPAYSFLHLITPHPPIVADADCAYVGRLALTRARYLEQARCALTAVRALLDRLRALDLYDRSAIVVTSDHGLGLFPPNHRRRRDSPSGEPLYRIMLDATPLLLIKPFGTQGPLEMSYAPTAMTDLPATLLDLAGLPNTLENGMSALALDPEIPRERTYANHSWGGQNNSRSRYFDVLHLYSVNGQVTNPDAWRYQRAIFEPTDDRETQYRTHRIGMSAAQDDTAEPSGHRVYRTDDYTAFFLRPDIERIALDVRQAKDSPPPTVTVRIDGQVVGRYPLSDDTWRRLDYPVEARDVDDSPFSVELLVTRVGYDAESPARGVMLRGDF